jgi:hypothetical protein
MIINRQSIEDIKNWTKLIQHPAAREIEDRISLLMSKRFGDSDWVFQNFTELYFDDENVLFDQDDIFDLEDCNYDGQNVYIPVIVITKGNVGLGLRKYFIDFNEICD